MKKLIIILFLMFALIIFAQEKTEYYSNGKVSSKGVLKNNIRIGDWVFYDKDEKINGKVSYDVNGAPIPDTFKVLDANGSLINFNCRVPTAMQFSNVCVAIYQRESAKNPQPNVSYGYQQDLWEMSCALVGIDNLDLARVKIQIMWNTNRENFRCYNYSNLVASEKNIMKFSLDSGFTTMLTEGVKRFNLDMNFLDPADDKTVLDFIKDRETHVLHTPPVDYDKAKKYKKIYDLLKKNGAKHSWELNQ